VGTSAGGVLLTRIVNGGERGARGVRRHDGATVWQRGRRRLTVRRIARNRALPSRPRTAAVVSPSGGDRGTEKPCESGATLAAALALGLKVAGHARTQSRRAGASGPSTLHAGCRRDVSRRHRFERGDRLGDQRRPAAAAAVPPERPPRRALLPLPAGHGLRLSVLRAVGPGVRRCAQPRRCLLRRRRLRVQLSEPDPSRRGVRADPHDGGHRRVLRRARCEATARACLHRGGIAAPRGVRRRPRSRDRQSPRLWRRNRGRIYDST